MAPPTPPAFSRLKPMLFMLVALTCLALGLAGLNGRSATNPLITSAEHRVQEVATATVAVYISLRAINAALSTAQEIEVGASAVGQASLQPLKVLEPVDDTVERVANVLFFVAAAAALATVGLGPVTSLGLILLGLGLMLRLFPALPDQLRVLGNTAVRFGLIIGVALPLVFSFGSTLGTWATEAQLTTAQGEIDRVAQQANLLLGNDTDRLSPTVAADDEDDGWFSAISSTWNNAADGVREVFQRSRQYLDAASVFISAADTILNASLTVIGVFALRMVVLPLLLLWAAWALLRSGGRQGG
ncbi:hypothetical protein [Thalassobius sp. Cn5-15]|uniref:hypothetical protein n=1 Tax=Thalassobius sp. Cn5-15 TaxID=2917763 RepID=UPI001EF1F4D6|nr:hypothetical protein [Thalassobius sp. Cn5-15]MCG7494366.1 hypothetical protein [Thalassobius sp. Cn5-15]